MVRTGDGAIGRRVRRVEDPPLVTGQGRFVADIDFPDQLQMRVVRAAHAHGRLVGIDADRARSLAGVVAVWTADDIADIPPIDFRSDRRAEALTAYRQLALARGVVRYVGEPVAAVFAEDAYVAEDAAELVAVEIAPLPAISSTDRPPGSFAPGRSSEAAVLTHGYGDLAAAFAEAAHVVALDLRTGRHSGVPLETRGALGVYDAARDLLSLHGAAKIPHRNKETLLRMLGLGPDQLHLHECHVGGGFGIRGELYPEDVLVLVAARRLGRPVKWIEDRAEHLTAANQGREQHHRARMALDGEGRVLGIEDSFDHDQGGYIRTHGVNVPNRTMCMMTGLYRVPAYRARCRLRLTNKTPAATYRAPGRYESTFVRERLMDAAAARLGLDRIEIRRRNLIPASEMPYTVAFDEPGVPSLHLDSGDYALLLDKALAAVGWDALQADLARRRRGGACVGAGVALFLEESGRGPSDGVRIAVDEGGGVEIVTGGASLGQGFETVMAQLCAGGLGCDHDRIRVVHGQTDRIARGIGAHATRATVVTGNAVYKAARLLRDRVLSAAALLLQRPADALTVEGGRVAAPGGASVSLGEIAAHLRGTPTGLSVEAVFETGHTVFPYGVHIAVVGIDRATGAVAVERFLVAYDVGRAVNPATLEGQLVGGCAQGIGGALLEEFVYDDQGQPLAVTLADYLMPTLSEIPAIECLITEDAPSPHNPLGLKGGGEGGINGAGAAIAGAIDDAAGVPGAVTRLPVTPARMRDILDMAAR